MTLKWHGGHDSKLQCVLPSVDRRQVSFLIVRRVSQATPAPSASCAGTCPDSQWRSRWGPSLGRSPPPRAGRGGLVVGAGILLLSGGPALMDDLAACAAQTTRQWPRWWSVSPLTPLWALNWRGSKAQEKGLSGSAGGGVAGSKALR